MHKLAVRVKGTDETLILAGTARKLIARLELFKVVHVNELRLRVIADSGLVLAKLRHIERGLRRNTSALRFLRRRGDGLAAAREEQHQHDGNNTFHHVLLHRLVSKLLS